jgi:hypothetical protein
LDRQRKPDIRNRLNVNKLTEDTKLYQKSWLDHEERMDRSRLPKLAFQYPPGDDSMLEDPGKDGKVKKILSFKGRGLKTEPLFTFAKKMMMMMILAFRNEQLLNAIGPFILIFFYLPLNVKTNVLLDCVVGTNLRTTVI